MEETMEEKVAQCSVATDCFDGFVDDIEWYGMVERSLDEMIDDESEVPDALIDYDSCDIAVEHLMAEEFIESLSDHERHIVKCLLDGMTHGAPGCPSQQRRSSHHICPGAALHTAPVGGREYRTYPLAPLREQGGRSASAPA